MIRPDMIGIRPLRPAVNAPLAVESPIIYSESAFFPVTRQGMMGGTMPGCRSPRVLPPPQPVLVLRDEVCKSAGHTISVPYYEELKTKPLVSDIEGNSFHLHPSGKLIHPHTGEVHGTYRWGRYKNRTILEATPKKEGMVYEAGSNEVLTPGVKPHVPPSHLRKSADDKKSDDWISEKIRLLMHEGKPQKQAIAIAYSMAGRSKVKKANIDLCNSMIELSKSNKF